MRAASLAFAALLAAHASAAAPREVVAELADTVEAHFYDEAKAREIAAGLRTEAEKGSYDTLTAPKDLAPALTAYLKPYDTHFNVEWVGDGAPEAEPPAGDPSVPKLPIPEALARNNHGFRKIEILPGNIAVIEMRSFDLTRAPGDPARIAADGALAAVSGAAAVIFDLRQSMGGAPDMVGYLASAFFAPGRDGIYNVFTSRSETRTEKPETPYANPRPDVPLYAVISGRTSSAAESFPYTLQAAGRATIVGEASSGAGNPGSVFPMKSGYTVFISLGRTENPITKSSWEKTGVIPDIEAPNSQALTAAYREALKTVSANAASPTDKVEAAWALEQLDAPTLAVETDDYVGSYQNTAIAMVSGALVYRRDRRPEALLVPLAPDVFGFADLPNRRIRFTRDASGAVTHLEEYSTIGDVLRLPRS